MPDDDSVRALLERLCSLQEQQLAKMSESLERYAEAKEKEQKLRELWERQMANYEQSQKAHEERAARHEKGVWVRAILTWSCSGSLPSPSLSRISYDSFVARHSV
jgi:hypothetical protein